VGCSGALGALDRGWEAAAAAVDGEQKLRRRSGEVESSAKERGEQNVRAQVQEQVHEELQNVLGVHKKAWSRGSRSWQAGGRCGSSGGGGATWRSEERDSTGWGTAARALGRHVARREAARGWPMLGTWPVKAAGVGRRENRGGGSWRYTMGTNV
jgi:hypothetical protein